jgi:hypothetical protein
MGSSRNIGMKRPSSIVPKSLQSERGIATSEQVPVISDNMERLMFRLVLILGGFLGVLFLGVIALLGIAFRPLPDMVVDPLERPEVNEAQQVVTFIEDRLPRLYTWAGVIRNPKDPSGLTFISDPGKEINLEDPDATNNPESAKNNLPTGRIPTSVYNEQFILGERIRLSTLREIAKVMERTGKVVFQTDPQNPFQGVSYRFVFRGRPQFPVEESPGRWKIIVNADIVRFSSTMSGTRTPSLVQDFNFIVYVRRSARVPNIVPDLDSKDGLDLVAYGKENGFEIDWMTPYLPQDETVPPVQ